MTKLSEVKQLTKYLKKSITVSRDGEPVVVGKLRAFWTDPPKSLSGYSDDLMVLWVNDEQKGRRVNKNDEIEVNDA